MGKKHTLSSSYTYRIGSEYIKYLDRSNENLLRYLDDVKNIKPLTEDEEKECINQLKMGGKLAEKAKNKLIVHNQRFIIAQAKRMCPSNMDICDFISEGNRGLIESFETFDPNMGGSFLRHAASYVFKYQNTFLKNNVLIKTKNMERVTPTMTAKLTKEFIIENEREPSNSELLEKYIQYGVKVRDIRDLNKIDVESMTIDDDDENKIKRQYGTEDDFESRLHTKLVHENINNFIETKLTPNEACVIKARFGFIDGIEKDIDMIAEEIGMTPKEVKLNLKRAMRKFNNQKKLFE